MTEQHDQPTPSQPVGGTPPPDGTGRRPRRGRTALVVVTAIAVCALVAGGGLLALARFGPSGFPLTKMAQEVFPGASSCPGAAGANSSWPDLVEAVVSSPAFAQQLEQIQKNMATAGMGSGTTITVESARTTMLAASDDPTHDSRFVPDGGDAKFAQAVCDAVSAHSGVRFGALTVPLADARSAGDAPEQIRMLGRMQCEAVGTSPGEKTIAPLKKEADAAAADPAAYKATMLGKLDQTLATYRSMKTSDLATSMIAETTATREKIAGTDPADIAAGLRIDQRVTEAALRYQCPRKLVLGYGPTCGTYSGNRAGSPTFTGTIHLRNDAIDCATARSELDHRFGPEANGPSTGTYEYLCRQVSSSDSEGALAYAVCGRDAHDPAWNAKDPEGVVVGRDK